MVEKVYTGNGIGTLQESSLHADLKRWYALPDDRLEDNINGYIVDIVRGDLLIEIQTRNFSSIRRKLARLVEHHPVRLVYPIAVEKHILKYSDPSADLPTVRKSPRKGRLEHLFLEMVRLADLACHPNFSLEVLLTKEEEVQVQDGKGSWRRRGWSITDRRLVGIVDRTIFAQPDDYGILLPAGLPSPFTTKQLSLALGLPVYVAQKMAYCLRQTGVLTVAGRQGRYIAYLQEK
jgi:hypothetical protein